jgi:hypothetical protein
MATPTRKYEALMNLSVPQSAAGLDTGKNDLVAKGEIVSLTEAQARGFLDKVPPRIRLASESSQPMPNIRPRDLIGRAFGPLVDARLDPAGSSALIVQERIIPEANEPQIGSETEDQDSIDLPPGTRISAGLTHVGA